MYNNEFSSKLYRRSEKNNTISTEYFGSSIYQKREEKQYFKYSLLKVLYDKNYHFDWKECDLSSVPFQEHILVQRYTKKKE